jgi:hypothetical protein
MDLYDFWRTVHNINKQYKHCRLGQVAFNYLSQVRPELSKRVRGTPCDPYYVVGDGEDWQRFCDFIFINWRDSQ